MARAKSSPQTKRSKAVREDSPPRLPPHSLEMERALLCSVLIDPNGIHRVIDKVSADSFYDPRHELIFGAMEALNRQSKPIDLLTVRDELDRLETLESAGGDPYLAELIGEVATSAHAEHYAGVVHQRKILRELISRASLLVAEAYESPEPMELLDRTMGALFDIIADRRGVGFESLKEAVTQVHDHLDRLHQRKDKMLTGVGTGFRRLDEMTSGFQPGDFIVIAGRPSMGKTALSLDLARVACSKYNVPVAYFSLEMASMAIAMRLLAAEAYMDLHKLRSGRLPESDWPRLALATSALAEMPFFIDDSGTLGLSELRARARMLQKKHNIGIIFIDYLQLMKPPPKADNREQEVAQISRGLKLLARELNIPVVAMSQLSRAVEQRGGDKRPQLADLRDSGAIEQDADVVMFIYREGAYQSGGKGDGEAAGEKGENLAEIIIRKQRNGPTGKVELRFHKEYAHFVQVEGDGELREASDGIAAAEAEQPPF